MPPAQMEPAQIEPARMVPAQWCRLRCRPDLDWAPQSGRQSPRLHISAKGVPPARSRRPTLIAWRLPSSFPRTG